MKNETIRVLNLNAQFKEGDKVVAYTVDEQSPPYKSYIKVEPFTVKPVIGTYFNGDSKIFCMGEYKVINVEGLFINIR